MLRMTLVVLTVVLTFRPFSLKAESQAVTFSFYSEKLTITYDTGLLLPFSGQIKEQNMVDYYHRLERRDYQTLLQALEQKRKALQLNDWLYFRLLRHSLDEIMPGQDDIQKELTCWFLLSQSGFDTRLTFRENEVFLYVYTRDEVFEVPMIQEKSRTYVNLTSMYHREEQDNQGALYLLNFIPRPDGRSFSFYLPRLPRLKPQLSARTFEFSYGEYVYRLDVNIDQTVVEIMEQYPFIAEHQYLEVPFSASVAASLLPQLRQMIHQRPEREAIEFLVAFTRSSFHYKDDKDYFGHSKPMIADEVFHYPFSDCEDRSALFFRLVRELLDLPMVIIAYQDHLTIGVALETPCGAPIPFEGRNYYICDPTGPVNSTIIGRPPRGYEFEPFEIIGRYK